MRRKTAVLLLSIMIGICSFFVGEKQVSAKEALPDGGNNAVENSAVDMSAYTAYLTMKEDTQVYSGPGKNYAPLGVLKEGQPAISVARTKDGWLYIYYIGIPAYIPENVTTEYKIPEPIAQKNIEIQGDIKINALGDSFTYGDKLKDKSMTFPNVVSRKCRAAVLNEYGLNGSCVAGMNPAKLLDRYPEMDRDANLILVLGGTNDYNGAGKIGTPLGALGDMTGATFYGGLNLLMCGLKQMYPESEIVFMTPTRRWGYTRNNQNGYNLAQYAAAIQEMAAFWGIRVIDLYNEPGLDFGGNQACYLVDGLHPNTTGHALIGTRVYQRLFENP